MDTSNHMAPKNYYSLIPLCFKVLDSNGDSVANHDIWLTGFSAIDVSQPEGIKYALRTYFENKYAIDHDLANKYFLVNPTDESETTGSTIVAGALDLNFDGAYDYNFGSMKEIIYGEYTGEATYSDSPFVAPNPNPLVDVNHTGKDISDENNASTFLAAHSDGAYVVDLTSVALKEAKYDTLATIAPEVDAYGYFSGGKPVAHTEADTVTKEQVDYTEYIAYTDLTIYLEGWDHCVINEVISASFNLGLQFEVNRL